MSCTAEIPYNVWRVWAQYMSCTAEIPYNVWRVWAQYMSCTAEIPYNVWRVWAQYMSCTAEIPYNVWRVWAQYMSCTADASEGHVDVETSMQSMSMKPHLHRVAATSGVRTELMLGYFQAVPTPVLITCEYYWTTSFLA